MDAFLYIDGFCPVCRSAAAMIARLDRRRRLEIVSFRDPKVALPPGLTLAQLETEMTLVETGTGRIRGGFDAVRALARYLPSLWPLRPLLSVIGWCGLGKCAYRYLAEHRRIIPDPRACRADAARPDCPTDEKPSPPAASSR